MSRWRRAARLAGHALALVTIFLCVLLPRSRHAWVGDLDPAVRPADLAGGGDDSALAVATFAVVALLIEALALATGAGGRGRIAPALLFLAVATSWGARLIG